MRVSKRVLSGIMGFIGHVLIGVGVLPNPIVQAAPFTLASRSYAAAVFVPSGEPQSVRLAAEDLINDTEKITGRRPTITHTAEQAGVVVVSLNQPESAALLEKLAPGFGDGLKGKWEAYRVETVGSRSPRGRCCDGSSP